MRAGPILGLGAALWAAFSFPASAQLSCASHKAITDQLTRGYGERLSAGGITDSGALVEMHKTPDGRSWTLILVLPDGRACLVAAGNEWRKFHTVAPRKGKGA
jgi:hypothetical protein